MSQRKCDECMMATAHCPALKPKIEEGATRDDVCEMTFEPKVKKDAGFTLIELIVVVMIVLIVGSVVVGGCSQFFFNKTVEGVITDNQVATQAVMNTANNTAASYSRAVCLRTSEEEITFSTEDRQFAVAKVGECAKVRIFQYPPWDFTKSGTYYNGRLLKKWQCTQSER